VEYPDAKYGLYSLIKFEDSAVRETCTRAFVLSSIFVNCKLTLNVMLILCETIRASHHMDRIGL